MALSSGLNLLRSLPSILNNVVTRTFKYEKRYRIMPGINQPPSIFKREEIDINNMPDPDLMMWKEQRSLFKIDKRGPLPKRRMKNPLDKRPQMRGVVLKTLVKKPKKPNSANRKCVYIRLSNGKEAVAFVPGIGHNLQEHSTVLVRWKRTQDVPGLKLEVIRGVYDCSLVMKQSSK